MILIDAIAEYPDAAIGKRARRYGTRWAHMVSTQSLEELLSFAARIGLRAKHLQTSNRVPHFDLTPSMHQRALGYGATIEKRAMLKSFRHDRPQDLRDELELRKPPRNAADAVRLASELVGPERVIVVARPDSETHETNPEGT